MKTPAGVLAIMLMALPQALPDQGTAAMFQTVSAPAAQATSAQAEVSAEGYQSWRDGEASFREGMRRQAMAQADLPRSR